MQRVPGSLAASEIDITTRRTFGMTGLEFAGIRLEHRPRSHGTQSLLRPTVRRMCTCGKLGTPSSFSNDPAGLSRAEDPRPAPLLKLRGERDDERGLSGMPGAAGQDRRAIKSGIRCRKTKIHDQEGSDQKRRH